MSITIATVCVSSRESWGRIFQAANVRLIKKYMQMYCSKTNYLYRVEISVKPQNTPKDKPDSRLHEQYHSPVYKVHQNPSHIPYLYTDPLVIYVHVGKSGEQWNETTLHYYVCVNQTHIFRSSSNPQKVDGMYFKAEAQIQPVTSSCTNTERLRKILGTHCLNLIGL